jgi:phosphate transport system permease protein
MAELTTRPPPASSTAPVVVRPRTLSKVARRVKLIDRAADLLIRTSGLGIIVIVALIFVFIGMEALPLFRGARQQERFAVTLPAPTQGRNVMALGVNEYESHYYFVDAAAGIVRFVDTTTLTVDADYPLAGLKGARVTSAYRTPARDKLILGTSDGRLLIAETDFTITYGAHGARTVKPGFKELTQIEVAPGGAEITRVHARQNSEGAYFYAAATADGRVFTGKFTEDEPNEEPAPVGGGFVGKITSLIIDQEGNRLFVATDAAKLYHYDLETDRNTPFRVYPMPANITALDYVIGNVALLLGFQDGSVESWFGVREKPADAQKPIHRIHVFERMPAAVTFIQPSGRDKGFAVGSADGTVKLNFTTSERTLLTTKYASGVAQLAYSPKLTALLALTENGRVHFAALDNPHPEISAKVLFGKVHYEGYDAPDYVWQSTGGTDDFEAKFSLVPLTIGTLKGAFYGLLFAIPVAVFAALYTSQFMTPQLRGFVKPGVEIMAALPSVVIGFLAGLWLAPKLEEGMIGTLLAIPIIPLMIVLGSAGWTLLPRRVRSNVPVGLELLLLLPLVIVGFWLSQQLGPVVEKLFFHGNYKQWVFDAFGKQFEQRNSIVIGIAMGFAVIPIIFTISEDAFSNVPEAFKSASYALGASRWQTAWRVILPTASPGVFSAVMIGFGRAVGETMIVLMATGNTPILSFSPFNGMRTLSANIAVEIPEAPVAGTLYRVLFVAAVLLFALTFAVNTVAELIRQRLREKYQAV